MSSIGQDVRFALRMLTRSPGFTMLAVSILALGIGANATLFTWMNAVLLKPLPGTQAPERLVEVHGTSRAETHISVSYPDFRDLRDAARSFSGLFATQEQPTALGVGGETERIWTQLVSANYFDVLGVEVARGRTFRPEEDQVPGRDAVVVLGHGLWQRRFGGDPSAIGREVTLNGHAFTVIGVAPPEFRGSIIALTFEAWVPMAMQQQLIPGGDRLEDRGHRWLDVMGRLASGTTLGQAQAEVKTVAERLAREYPNTNETIGLATFALHESPRGAARTLGPVFSVLAAAVGLVLLVACANVANLLLARATGRRREIAVRRALGASRARLVRQLLTESLALAALAGLGGVLMAFWCSGLLLTFVPPTDFPVGLELGVDRRALLFAVALAALTGVLFGLAPALRISNPELVPALKEGVGAAGGRARTRFRNGLVVAQVALSLTLLTGAGLLLRSLSAAQSFNPGFDTRHVLLGTLDLFGAGYDATRGRTLFRDLLRITRNLPGVESVTLARRVPLSLGGTSSTGLAVEGYTPPPGESTWAYFNKVGPGYFETLRIPLLAGRDLTTADDEGSPRTIVVNETMARRYWPQGQAVGGRVRLDETTHTVVGVARDIRYRRLDEAPAPVMYLPLLQSWSDAAVLHVRTEGDPLAAAPAIRAALRRLDPALPLDSQRTLEESVKAATITQRLAGTFVSIFGAVALLLAAVGLYGVLQNAVAERAREIGIRVALGGSRGDILRLVSRPALRLSALGIALGLLGSAGLARLVARILFGVSPFDPLTLGAVAALMLAVALVATVAPAWRATRVDPALALRQE